MNVNAQTFELLPRKNSESFLKRKKLRTMSQSRLPNPLKDYKKVSIELPAIRLSTPSSHFHPLPQCDTSQEKVSAKFLSDKLHQEILNKIDRNILKTKTFWSSNAMNTSHDRQFSCVDLMSGKIKFRDSIRRIQRGKLQSSLKMFNPYFKKVAISNHKQNQFNSEQFLRRRIGRSPNKIQEISEIYSNNLTPIN